MCGIFAYTGTKGKDASKVLLDGLLALEYRGYDSAGIYTPESGAVKTPGAVRELRKKIPADFKGKSGIAHLRWATHGEPTEVNAHPHSGGGDIWLVHNGIIENFQELKDMLMEKGHEFKSGTDTEVLAHLVEEKMNEVRPSFAKASEGKKSSVDQGLDGLFERAVLAALQEVHGTYGLAVQYKKEPSKLIAARMGSPIVLGIGDGEHFIASDPSPIVPHSKKVVFLEDGEMAVITPEMHTIYKLDSTQVGREITEIDWSAEEAQKGGYEHFMLKEIMEEPDAVRNSLRGRLLEDGSVRLKGLESVEDKLKNVKRIIIVACGTAFYAGQVAEYMFEEYAGIPVSVEIASEFRYKKPVIESGTLVIAISQSGETLDTLEAMREGKRRGALTIGIVNTVGSTIARETDAGIYNHVGPEISVASTKAFVSQLAVLALLAMHMGRQRGMKDETFASIAKELKLIPEKMEKILASTGAVKALAKKYAYARDFLYIGRTYNFPVAYEGAIKLKELSYIHAEGCGAGEMKHGPIAMIDRQFPTFAIALKDSVYEKMCSNIQEIRARKGPVIALGTDGDSLLAKIADDALYVPKTLDMLSPLLSVVPLQLFAYYFAAAKGYNVDRPRNLAKSVTVE
ncbi:glutamine--fructose-6-phosphate transaminase (isomerizing) [Candidatus Kaiserbacteria bacterium]|nr:glutamine--fructose-6-phosphate transaminase (isomerizing) [Candidatus Kaiserbacteria bacterium]